ncbi:hypothetical protein [Halorussus salinus]|nr:hypothetical protein [Halorussus salinus]
MNDADLELLEDALHELRSDNPGKVESAKANLELVVERYGGDA